MKLPFTLQHIGIYGAGLLGGSLGLAIKQKHAAIRITGIGRSAEKLQTAVDLGAIDDYACDPSTLPESSFDLLILCTPVKLIASHLQSVIHAVKPNSPITDVGSTKTLLVSACEEAAGSRNPFVGSHPMAGSHQSGIEAAHADLFRDKICIITKTDSTDPIAQQNIVSFWQWLAMKTITLSPKNHDTLTARSSHLPHIMASALCKVAEAYGEDLITILGDGFRDTTRVAAGDPTLWLNICLENRAELVQSLEEMRQVTDDLITWMKDGNQDKIYTFLQQTQLWKQKSEEKQ